MTGGLLPASPRGVTRGVSLEPRESGFLGTTHSYAACVKVTDVALGGLYSN